MQNFLVLAALLATGGCSHLLNPEGRFSFSATKPGMNASPPFASVTGVAQRQIQFAGTITTPTPCYRVSGAGDVTGGHITITVTATSTLGPNEGCATVIAAADYAGAVRELTPGSYRVVVIHTIPKTGWPVQPIADTLVVVP
ncbi:MAG: hypothetical protein ACR2L6_11760 [Gemmatimonadaceae bacterium]